MMKALILTNVYNIKQLDIFFDSIYKDMRSEATKELYQSNYKRLVDKYGDNFTADNIKDYVKELKPNSKLSYVQSVVVTRDLKSGPIYDYFIELRKTDNTMQPLTESEQKTEFRWKEVFDRLGFLSEGTFKHLLLSLYTYIPPLRSSEYVNVRIDDSEFPNYLDREKSQFVIRESKTSNKFAERIIPIPKKLLTIINKWIDINSLKKGDYLFAKLYTSSGITKALNSIFGKKVSVDLLRKTYITEITPVLTINERKELATIMGHALQTQIAVYDKNMSGGSIIRVTNK